MTKRFCYKPLTPLGLMLRHQRLDKNISMSQMAENCGISNTLLSHIEHGERNMTESVSEKIIKYFGLKGESLKEFKELVLKSSNVRFGIREDVKAIAIRLNEVFNKLKPSELERIEKIISKYESD